MPDSEDCTLGTCPLSMAYVEYQPSVPANALFLGLFAAMIVGQIGLGFKFRTWSYMVPMLAGLVLEVLGYLGRIMVHNDPFSFDAFLLYLICLTIAPAFFTAGIYLCLGRIVAVYGTEYSRLKPRTYTYIFVSCDIISLILQAAGGAITSIADDKPTSDMGINVMIAGLIFQVVSLAGFMVLTVEYGIRVRRGRRASVAPRPLRENWKHKAFLWGLATATVTIFVRSIFRVAELQGGFHSDLANNEVDLMILESAMVSIAGICLTVLHPAMLVGKKWKVKEWDSKSDESKNEALLGVENA
ncbi:hypothetical protein N7492_000210 [Penicillium capsulatum]|uniref:RTA1 domain protein n=1 Tax=Penicillium capsulatum TaxID=69766 RepID=A0A9W9IP59_9EURO|nr:hypothetical protein N7492_000210 [Penicillium capsulatum]KAJ6130725.1 hypothetical protein N7512_003505 [Penicillium capsulatum]